MLPHIALENILFLDIETAPVRYRFDELDAQGQELWSAKTKWIQQREEKSAEEVYERAGIYAEFAQVVCVSFGYFHGEREFRVKSSYGEVEKDVLQEVAHYFERFFEDRDGLLCAHNGKEFDFPFLARRYVINGLELPPVLQIAGKKPWEVNHLDTMDLWKFGDYKHYTSVDLLSYSMGLESPKDDISGADVARVFHEEKDIERIRIYCEKDVLAVARIMLRFKGLPDVQPSAVLQV